MNSIIEERNNLKRSFLLQSKNILNEKYIDVSPDDLKLLFLLYDKIFFDNYFGKKSDLKFKFSVSKRMTKAAGKTIWQKNFLSIPENERFIEIRVSSHLLELYALSEDTKCVNGIIANDKLEALMLIMEHEMCHVMEISLYGNTNCKKDRFKKIASKTFGHTNSYHQLPTNAETYKDLYKISIGDTVEFEFKKSTLKGIIYSINKLVAVLVLDNDGIYIDKLGKRYSKFYVSAQNLVKKC